MNSYYSAFDGWYCDKVGVIEHEIGHNLNLAHSGEGSQEYGDETGAMGAGAALYDNSLGGICFNGAKSWQLGWTEDKHLELTPSENPITIKLKGVVDYHTAAADEYVAARIAGIGDNNYCLLYTSPSPRD